LSQSDHVKRRLTYKVNINMDINVDININVSLEECVTKCYTKEKCTHYTWELHSKENSSCKLMNGNVLKSEASIATSPYVFCGIKGETAIDKTLLPKIGN